MTGPVKTIVNKAGNTVKLSSERLDDGKLMRAAVERDKNGQSIKKSAWVKGEIDNTYISNTPGSKNGKMYQFFNGKLDNVQDDETNTMMMRDKKIFYDQHGRIVRVHKFS